MAQDAVLRNGGSVIAGGDNQLASVQVLQRGLDGALRKTGRFRERAQTCGHRFPFRARGLAVEMQVNKIRGRLAVVPDDIAHQDVDDVIVDRNGLAKKRQVPTMNEDGRRMK